jgi:hypothetical protein
MAFVRGGCGDHLTGISATRSRSDVRLRGILRRLESSKMVLGGSIERRSASNEPFKFDSPICD